MLQGSEIAYITCVKCQMNRGVKGEPIRQFSVSSPVLTVRRLAKTDTPEEMQCDVVKFGVMHAGPFKASAQPEPEHLASTASACPPPFACHANSTRSTSETIRKQSRSNSPLAWSPPLSRMRASRLSHAEVSMHAKCDSRLSPPNSKKATKSLDPPLRTWVRPSRSHTG